MLQNSSPKRQIEQPPKECTVRLLAMLIQNIASAALRSFHPEFKL